MAVHSSSVINEGDLFPLADVLGVPLRVVKKANGKLGLSAFVQLALPMGPFKWPLKFTTCESYLSIAGTTSCIVMGSSDPCDLFVVLCLDHKRGALELLLLDASKLEKGKAGSLILPEEWSRKLFLFNVRNAVIERYTARVGSTFWSPTSDASQWVQQYLLGREEGHLSSDNAMAYADGVDLGAIGIGQYEEASKIVGAGKLVSDVMSKAARGNKQA